MRLPGPHNWSNANENSFILGQLRGGRVGLDLFEMDAFLAEGNPCGKGAVGVADRATTHAPGFFGAMP